METKHTPGPFKVERVENPASERTLYQVRADDGSAEPIVCLVRDTPDGEISADEAEANARLIAAAPDMLEALELAADRLELNNCEGEEDEFLATIRAAIAKAKGGAA